MATRTNDLRWEDKKLIIRSWWSKKDVKREDFVSPRRIKDTLYLYGQPAELNTPRGIEIEILDAYLESQGNPNIFVPIYVPRWSDN